MKYIYCEFLSLGFKRFGARTIQMRFIFCIALRFWLQNIGLILNKINSQSFPLSWDLTPSVGCNGNARRQKQSQTFTAFSRLESLYRSQRHGLCLEWSFRLELWFEPDPKLAVGAASFSTASTTCRLHYHFLTSLRFRYTETESFGGQTYHSNERTMP